MQLGHLLCLLNETWSNDTYDLDLPGYNYKAIHRSKKRPGTVKDSGGLIVYYKTELDKAIEIVNNFEDHLLWIKLDGQYFHWATDLLVCLCYTVPRSSSRQDLIETHVFDQINNDLADFHGRYGDNCQYMIVGDMNARTGEYKDYVDHDELNYIPVPEDYEVDEDVPARVSCDKKAPDEFGYKLLDLCKTCSLRIVNGRIGSDKGIGNYTSVNSRGKSVIDYVLCKPDMFKWFCEFKIHDVCEWSDHCKLSLAVKTKCVPKANCKPGVIHKFRWDNDKKDEFVNCLGDIVPDIENVIQSLTDNLTEEKVDESLQTITNLMHGIAEPLFGKKCKTNVIHNVETPPYYTDECENKRKTFFDTLNVYRRDGSDINRRVMVDARRAFKDMARKCRREYDINETRKLTRAKLNNANEYWKLLKGKRAAAKTHDITTTEFYDYFVRISNPGADIIVLESDDMNDNVQMYEAGELEVHVLYEELNTHVTLEEVVKAIKQLKCGKSAGLDLLLNEFYVYGCEMLTGPLCSLFNCILRLGYFPEKWTSGLIVPLHKKGDVNCVENYRGITLLSTLGKLFTRVLNNRLSFWAETYSVYIEAQAGFRQNFSTTDNIFNLHGVISHLLNNGKKLYCAFLDFRKAFDYVDRNLLWHKLLALGIRGQIFDVIQSMYKRVKSQVQVGADRTEQFECLLGVRQGECLSPFLFAMYLNDIEESLRRDDFKGVNIGHMKMLTLLYADDAVIMSENRDELQLGLNILEEYCAKWKITLNTDKTKVVVFKKGGRLAANDKWFYQGGPLEVVKHFTYLGIVFSSGGSFSENQKTLAGQAQKAIFALIKMLKKFEHVTHDIFCDLFDKMIMPILCYGSEVWGFHCGDAVERAHLQFCKKVLRLKWNTVNNIVYSELGRTNTQCVRFVRIVKYWLKIMKCDDTRLIKRVYNVLLIDADNGKVNWVSLLRNLLQTCGFGHVWQNQGVQETGAFLKVFKQRVRDNFGQTIHRELQNSSRGKNYVLHHENFISAKYLDIVKTAQVTTD